MTTLSVRKTTKAMMRANVFRSLLQISLTVLRRGVMAFIKLRLRCILHCSSQEDSCDLARQLNRSVRSPSIVSRRVGRSSLATAVLELWLLNHVLRETHSFHQLAETKIVAQGI